VLTLAGAKVSCRSRRCTTPPKTATCSSGTTMSPHRAAGTKPSPSSTTTPRSSAAAGARRTLHRARQRVHVVIAPACLRPHQSLRPHSPSAWGPTISNLQPRGKGFDCPSPTTIRAYYDKAEELIGVFGSQRVWRSTPMASSSPRPPLAPMRRSQEGLRQAQDSVHPFAPRDPHQAPQRTARVPLLAPSADAPARSTPTFASPASTSHRP